LARALLLQPPILLVDEPTNDLDPKLAETVSNELLKTRNEGTTVVIVTHDYSLAAKTDVIFKLHNGMLNKKVFN
jgi:putative ABC transport system ATP-binding protein